MKGMGFGSSPSVIACLCRLNALASARVFSAYGQGRLPTPTNLLEHSASAYLRSARHQPVRWHPWGDAAFALAKSEDKPILLDIGAVWCHWCHVMDRESYENPQIAALINELFIAVKVDRDERPDVDARYQAAVSAITGQGGWPLTLFSPQTGGPTSAARTFLPMIAMAGPVLAACSPPWPRSGASAAMRRRKPQPAPWPPSSTMNLFPGQRAALVGVGRQDRQLDPPPVRPAQRRLRLSAKISSPGALDLLLHIGVNRGNQPAIHAFSATLEHMARGGVYDQLAGGFHRYSVDEHWRVPHFEKMLYDNTELLRNYLHGYQSLADENYAREDFRRIAEEITTWLLTTMSDRDRGGFYASQDADINLDDDGDYFTWTLAEARVALLAAEFSPDEISLALRYWDIGELATCITTRPATSFT